MNLSDDARSILVFAAYHELTSGEPVKEVVLDDGAGHKASGKGQEELIEAGLIRINSDRAHITEDGEQVLVEILNAIRQATGD
ncbi:hypothetical protein GAO09_04865 [Rhizobiales bacterium RZME27]|jgi:hypothetical protein|uniref:Uncharacterized protein n=1 Tax=Endobacterium cereale TaxID=2663029 RepID=A0A6A8A820_9HYPH|nr:hypothetical protein [Endobacterium cereale]MEB2846523.1 hypothetical protein [Endobacterium cereale]MQY45396.1 hypothetical protein [Endobacterium cereale]